MITNSLDNPFDPSFNNVPKLFLDYESVANGIVNDLETTDSAQSYFITGVRGSGKTVLLNRTGEILHKTGRFIVVRTHNNNSLFEVLYKNLSVIKSRYHIDEVDLPLIKVKADELVTEADYEEAITDFLKNLALLPPQGKKDHKYKVSLVILFDEVSNTEAVQNFANAFSDWKSDKLPVHVLMTGLLKEVSNLACDNNLTFLLRSNRIYMRPLQEKSIVDTYMKVFNGHEELAHNMALKTRGFAYAFQLLGSLVFESINSGGFDGAVDRILHRYKQRLAENVYHENVHVLTNRTQDYLKAAAKGGGLAHNIVKIMGVSKQDAGNYRKRCLCYGLIYPVKTGLVDFTLPYFKDFLLDSSLAINPGMIYSWGYGQY